jgi:hypothetical protein
VCVYVPFAFLYSLEVGQKKQQVIKRNFGSFTCSSLFLTLSHTHSKHSRSFLLRVAQKKLFSPPFIRQCVSECVCVCVMPTSTLVHIQAWQSSHFWTKKSSIAKLSLPYPFKVKHPPPILPPSLSFAYRARSSSPKRTKGDRGFKYVHKKAKLISKLQKINKTCS